MLSHLYEAKRRGWTVPRRWPLLDELVQKMVLPDDDSRVPIRDDDSRVPIRDVSDDNESSSDNDVEIIDRKPLAVVELASSDDEAP